MRKQKQIELFGKKVLLSERNHFDILVLSNVVDSTQLNAVNAHYINCVALRDSLKHYLIGWKYFSRYRYSVKKLFKKLKQNESTELVNILAELEGSKKKVMAEGNQ